MLKSTFIDKKTLFNKHNHDSA